jgi:hypothetical protein
MRLVHIATFSVALLTGNCGRLNKPCNPILGETYELIGDNFKFFCEQVSHHPPISASYAESEDYLWHYTLDNTNALTIKGAYESKALTH